MPLAVALGRQCFADVEMLFTLASQGPRQWHPANPKCPTSLARCLRSRPRVTLNPKCPASTCCGRMQGSFDPYGHGTIINVDNLGRGTHTAQVSSVTAHAADYKADARIEDGDPRGVHLPVERFSLDGPQIFIEVAPKNHHACRQGPPYGAGTGSKAGAGVGATAAGRRTTV